MQTVYDKSGNQSSLLNVKVIETDLALKGKLIDDSFISAIMIFAIAKTASNEVFYGITTGFYDGSYKSDVGKGTLALQLVGNELQYSWNSADNDNSIVIDRIVVFY